MTELWAKEGFMQKISFLGQKRLVSQKGKSLAKLLSSIPRLQSSLRAIRVIYPIFQLAYKMQTTHGVSIFWYFHPVITLY